MKYLSAFFLIFLVSSFLTAKTAVKCLPPSDLQAVPVHNGAHLSWNYQTPDTVISFNDGYPSGVWNTGQYHALGVVYDLSAFSGATLAKLDFVHYSREKLAGPYLYRIHILDMDNSAVVAVIDSLTAGDAYDMPRYEIGIELDSIAAPARVGIFIEGLSIITENGKAYSFPVVMSDTSTYIDNLNFYCTDTRDPFYASDPNFSNIYDAKMVSGGGDKTTNFIIDLWINYENVSTRISSLSPAGQAVTPHAAETTVLDLEPMHRLNGSYHSLKAASSPPLEFKIFKGSVEDSLVLIDAVPGDCLAYDYVGLAEQTPYYFGVSAVNDLSVSLIEKISYKHPKTWSVSEIRADENADFVPDSLGKEVYFAGLVNSPNLSENGAYYVQDTDAGLLLGCNSAELDLQVGDSVFAHGFIQQQQGLTVVALDAPSDVQVFAAGNTPDTVKLAILDESEDYEGQLVMLENVFIVNPGSWPAAGVDGLKQISDGSHQLDLFIDKETDIDGWTPPQGNMNLIGVLSQSTTSVPPFDGYRVIPRFQSDFIPVVGINENASLSAHSFALRQNYPNPFNPETVISYKLAVGSWVRLSVYNALGQEVKRLVNNRQEVGAHSVKFDGINLPSGVYFYQLKAGAFEQTRKMLLLR